MRKCLKFFPRRNPQQRDMNFHMPKDRVSKGWHSPGQQAGNDSLTPPGLPAACPGRNEPWSDSWEALKSTLPWALPTPSNHSHTRALCCLLKQMHSKVGRLNSHFGLFPRQCCHDLVTASTVVCKDSRKRTLLQHALELGCSNPKARDSFTKAAAILSMKTTLDHAGHK